MSRVIRETIATGVVVDRGALPCPRCRSLNTQRDSHPATGPMATCGDCGGRSSLREWNDGMLQMQRSGSAFVTRIEGFVRPSTDVIEEIRHGE